MTPSPSVFARLFSEKVVVLVLLDVCLDLLMLIRPLWRLIGIACILLTHSMAIKLIQLTVIRQPEQLPQVRCLDACNSALLDGIGSIFMYAEETTFDSSAIHRRRRTLRVNTFQLFDHSLVIVCADG